MVILKLSDSTRPFFNMRPCMSKIAYVEPIGAAEICKVRSNACMANGVDKTIGVKFVLILELDFALLLELNPLLELLFVAEQDELPYFKF